eukprot:319242-Chlamydomonas_euryale.AAC.3
MGAWMDGWMDGRTDGRTDGWMDGWMDGRMDGWMDVRNLLKLSRVGQALQHAIGKQEASTQSRVQFNFKSKSNAKPMRDHRGCTLKQTPGMRKTPAEAGPRCVLLFPSFALSRTYTPASARAHHWGQGQIRSQPALSATVAPRRQACPGAEARLRRWPASGPMCRGRCAKSETLAWRWGPWRCSVYLGGMFKGRGGRNCDGRLFGADCPDAGCPGAGCPVAGCPDAGCPGADCPGAGCPGADCPVAGCPGAGCLDAGCPG